MTFNSLIYSWSFNYKTCREVWRTRRWSCYWWAWTVL